MEDLVQTNYALDTFYFLVMGAMVMFMAPGFAMLEAGLVRAKNTTEILLKNVALFAIACIMYLLVGYNLMYGAGNSFIGGGFLLSGIAGEDGPTHHGTLDIPYMLSVPGMTVYEMKRFELFFNPCLPDNSLKFFDMK